MVLYYSTKNYCINNSIRCYVLNKNITLNSPTLLTWPPSIFARFWVAPLTFCGLLGAPKQYKHTCGSLIHQKGSCIKLFLSSREYQTEINAPTLPAVFTGICSCTKATDFCEDLDTPIDCRLYKAIKYVQQNVWLSVTWFGSTSWYRKAHYIFTWILWEGFLLASNFCSKTLNNLLVIVDPKCHPYLVGHLL